MRRRRMTAFPPDDVRVPSVQSARELASTRSRVSGSREAARKGCRNRFAACRVTQRFSATLSCGNTLLICIVRLMPSRLISCGLSPVMSRPLKNTRPLSAASKPETRLKNVVLPAPFGPMMACRRPLGMLRLSLSTAVKPPKLLVKFSVRRAGSVMARSAVLF